MEVFAYADETAFKPLETSSESYVGSGVFTSKSKIENKIIEEALCNLENDPSKNKKDLKTINRNFFHSSDDSHLAHKYFCEAIKKNISGQFKYSIFNQNNQNRIRGERTPEELNRLTLKLSSLTFFDRRYDKVFLTIEQRNNFNISDAERLKESLYKDIDMQTYEHPSFITYYPDIVVDIGNKHNPGMQVVDFLLWVINRTHRDDDRWKKELGFKLFSSFQEQDGPQRGGDYYINSTIELNSNLNYPIKAEEPKSIDEFYQSYINIENILKQLYNQELPEHVLHLKPKLKSVYEKLKNIDYNFNKETLDEVSSIFIRLFDTVPIYESVDKNEHEKWNILLKSKKMAGLFLRHDLLHGNRSANAIVRWRKDVISTNSSIFSNF